MKVSGEVRKMTVSQRQMASALGLSTTRVNELINEKVLIRDESHLDGRLMLYDSLENYFLSKKPTTSGASFWNERALHEKAKRELAELTLAQRRGELCEISQVERELGEVLTDCRNKLLGLGHKLANRLAGKTAAVISDIIDGEIIEILEELSRDVEVEVEPEAAESAVGE